MEVDECGVVEFVFGEFGLVFEVHEVSDGLFDFRGKRRFADD